MSDTTQGDMITSQPQYDTPRVTQIEREQTSTLAPPNSEPRLPVVKTDHENYSNLGTSPSTSPTNTDFLRATVDHHDYSTPPTILDRYGSFVHKRIPGIHVGEVLYHRKSNYEYDYYFSERGLRELMTQEWLEEVFKSYHPPSQNDDDDLSTVDNIHLMIQLGADNPDWDLQKTCAILISIGEVPGSMLGQFYEKCKTDRNLPYTINDLVDLAWWYGWPKHTVRNFYVAQFNWAYRFQPCSLRKLDDKVILPITSKKRMTSGVQSQMFRIEIDPEFDELEVENEGATHEYALKLETFDTKVSYREAKLLSIYRKKSDHIVPLLCSFRYRDELYYIFPLAECNLEEYMSWDRKEKIWSPPPPETSLERYIFLHGISKLTGGLSALHDSLEDILYGGTSIKYRCSHKDVAAINILKLKEDWVLADLGFSSLRKEILEETNELVLDGAIQRPKPTVGLHQHDARDIRQLGGVFLDAAVFACHGREGYKNLRSVSLEKVKDPGKSKKIRNYTLPAVKEIFAKICTQYETSDPVLPKFIEHAQHMVLAGSQGGTSNVDVTVKEHHKLFTELFKKHSAPKPPPQQPISALNDDTKSRCSAHNRSASGREMLSRSGMAALLKDLSMAILIDDSHRMSHDEFRLANCAFKILADLLQAKTADWKYLRFSDDINATRDHGWTDLRDGDVNLRQRKVSGMPVHQLLDYLLKETAKPGQMRSQGTSPMDKRPPYFVIITNGEFMYDKDVGNYRIEHEGCTKVFRNAERDLPNRVHVLFLEIRPSDEATILKEWARNTSERTQSMKKIKIMVEPCVPDSLAPKIKSQALHKAMDKHIRKILWKNVETEHH